MSESRRPGFNVSAQIIELLLQRFLLAQQPFHLRFVAFVHAAFGLADVRRTNLMMES
jgi:hypothetical protein